MNEMRMSSLVLRDFRGIRNAEVNLNASVVLIYGRNGVGKTALFDAIEYALFRRNRRLQAMGEKWEEYLPNVHGDGSFDLHVGFSTGERIDVARKANGEVEGSWAGRPQVRDFVYDFLMRQPVVGRRNVAAVHELALATHILPQSEMAKLAASESLKSEMLAGLTGSGYLERCRDKAAQTGAQLHRMLRDVDERRERATDERQVRATEVERTRELLARRERLVEKVRRQGRGEVSLELLADPDRKGVAGLLADMAGRIRDELQAKQRAIVSVRSLLEVSPLSITEPVVRDSVAGIVQERLNAIMDRERASEQLAIAREALAAGLAQHNSVNSRRAAIAACARRAAELAMSRNRLAQAEQQVLKAKTARVGADGAFSAAARRDERSSEALANARAAEGPLQAKLNTLKETGAAVARWSGELRRLGKQRDELRLSLADAVQKSDAAAISAKTAQQMLEQHRDTLATLAPELTQLVTRLRQLLKGNISHCPLCGTRFSSARELREAARQHGDRHSAIIGEAERRFEKATKLSQSASESDAACRMLTDTLTTQLAAIETRYRMADSEAQAATARQAAFLPAGSTAEAVAAELTGQAALASRRVGEALSESNEARADANRLSKALNSASATHEELASSYRQAAMDMQSLEGALKSEAAKLAVEPNIEALAAEARALEVESHVAGERGTALSDVVRDAEATLVESARRITVVEQRLVLEQKRLQGIENARAAREAELALLGVPSDSPKEKLSAVEAGLVSEAGRLAELADATEEIARISVSAESVDLRKAKTQLATANEELEALASDRKYIGDAATVSTLWEEALHRRVESAVRDFVLPRQTEIDDTFRSLIADPFRFDRIAVEAGQTGSLSIGLVFRSLADTKPAPEFYLSGAQMSALALAIFLALSRSQSWSSLDTMFLDDPVQHLDDLDCVALLDGLRRVTRGARGKQLVVSTCDRGLYHQMIRKFSLGGAPRKQSVIAVTLEEDLKSGVAVRYDVGDSLGSVSAAG